MYLLIGTPFDACIERVHRRLQAAGEEVLVTPEPLAGEAQVRWDLTTAYSLSHLRLGQHSLSQGDLCGVLVRGSGVPLQATDWDPKDYAYMQAEAQSALLAWLKSLPCPVVNPARAETFYRERTLPEQRVWLARAGFPTAPVLVTNSPAEARGFARRWGGNLSYVPLTSTTRYPIDTPAQWAELERLMTRFPLALMEPEGPSFYLSLAADRLLWSEGPDSRVEPTPKQKERLGDATRRLAGLLGVQMLQVEIQLSDGHPPGYRRENTPRAFGFSLYPEFALYGEAEQEELAQGVVAALQGVRA
ncbi:MAG: hypothetical protein HZB27_06610 [Meiothermus silvanus]|nr:hypothetical protein [Allomeiothermus silvanus]